MEVAVASSWLLLFALSPKNSILYACATCCCLLSLPVGCPFFLKGFHCYHHCLCIIDVTKLSLPLLFLQLLSPPLVLPPLVSLAVAACAAIRYCSCMLLHLGPTCAITINHHHWLWMSSSPLTDAIDHCHWPLLLTVTIVHHHWLLLLTIDGHCCHLHHHLCYCWLILY